jgi:hypothetical protein
LLLQISGELRSTYPAMQDYPLVRWAPPFGSLRFRQASARKVK